MLSVERHISARGRWIARQFSGCLASLPFVELKLKETYFYYVLSDSKISFVIHFLIFLNIRYKSGKMDYAREFEISQLFVRNENRRRHSRIFSMEGTLFLLNDLFTDYIKVFASNQWSNVGIGILKVSICWGHIFLDNLRQVTNLSPRGHEESNFVVHSSDGVRLSASFKLILKGSLFRVYKFILSQVYKLIRDGLVKRTWEIKIINL